MRSQPAKPGSRWLLHSEAAFGIALALPARHRRQFGCGCSSVVEHDLAKVGVEGSSPFARSKNLNALWRERHALLCACVLIFASGDSGFLTTRLHAHPIFGLAGRAGIVLHAGALLVGAYFAVRLSLCRVIGSIKTAEHQQGDPENSHVQISSSN